MDLAPGLEKYFSSLMAAYRNNCYIQDIVFHLLEQCGKHLNHFHGVG